MLERPSDAIVVFRLLLSVVVAALAASLVARQGYRTWVQVTVGVLVSGSSAFVGLYAEGYMSREFFVSWSLIGLLMVGHQFLDDDRRSSAWWRVGIVASVSLAIVPPYFLLGPALLLAMVLSSVGRPVAVNAVYLASGSDRSDAVDRCLRPPQPVLAPKLLGCQPVHRLAEFARAKRRRSLLRQSPVPRRDARTRAVPPPGRVPTRRVDDSHRATEVGHRLDGELNRRRRIHRGSQSGSSCCGVDRQSV